MHGYILSLLLLFPDESRLSAKHLFSKLLTPRKCGTEPLSVTEVEDLVLSTTEEYLKLIDILLYTFLFRLGCIFIRDGADQIPAGKKLIKWWSGCRRKEEEEEERQQI